MEDTKNIKNKIAMSSLRIASKLMIEDDVNKRLNLVSSLILLGISSNVEDDEAMRLLLAARRLSNI